MAKKREALKKSLTSGKKRKTKQKKVAEKSVAKRGGGEVPQ